MGEEEREDSMSWSNDVDPAPLTHFLEDIPFFDQMRWLVMKTTTHFLIIRQMLQIKIKWLKFT